jgi:hypothetical protein
VGDEETWMRTRVERDREFQAFDELKDNALYTTSRIASLVTDMLDRAD